MGYSRQYVDDMDGAPITDRDKGKVRFALEDEAFEIDLTNRNFDRLKAALAPFIQKAKVASDGGQYRPMTRSQARARRNTIRNWLRGEGYELSDKGRIPLEMLELYREAHSID